MVKKIRWVEVEVSGASSDVDGNCTTFYSAGPPATITITNTLGKKSKVGLKRMVPRSRSVTTRDSYSGRRHVAKIVRTLDGSIAVLSEGLWVSLWRRPGSGSNPRAL